MLKTTSFYDVEVSHRQNPHKKRLSFGIDYLDEATGGILESDLIILGARAGVGKTEIATMIAQSNALANKRVVFYALEADQDEIHNRILYREISKLYIKNSKKRFISYRKFILGEIDTIIKEEREEALTNMATKYSSLKVIYKKADDITPEDLAEDMELRYQETDLFILDHIHYVDHQDDNENRGLKNLAKKLRNTALVFNTPVLAIAHLRKRGFQNKDIIPSMDEFHGSSDITKIATKAITLAPYDSSDLPYYLRNTLLRIVKNRIDGSVTSYLAKLKFNIKTNTYETKKQIGHMAKCYKEFTPIGLENYDKLPEWAQTIRNEGGLE